MTLAPVYAVRITACGITAYLPRSPAATTQTVPKLWVKRKDAERAARNYRRLPGRVVEVVEFTLNAVRVVPEATP